MRRGVHDIDGDPHVPVALGRAIAALDIRFEFHGKTEIAQNLLELLLFAVTPIDGVGIRLDNLPALADIGPQGGVVEVATISLAHGVIEVLYIGEHRDFLHRKSSWRRRAQAGSNDPEIGSVLSMPAWGIFEEKGCYPCSAL